jgi:hypothetical protein
MNKEALQKFANMLDADTEQVMDRWEGRPDRIIDDLFRIRDQDTGQLRDLELFDVQRELVHAYFYGDVGTLNAYKGRRIGYSFVVVACFLLEGMFYPDSYYPLVSRSLTQSKARISDIQDLIDHAKIEIPTETTNKDRIVLWNDSAFEAFSSESDTSRGRDSARAVLMDEMAFMENEQEAHRAFGAFLALGENRKMVQVSTPNTKNDLFMQQHRSGSRQGDDGIISIRQPTFENADEIDVHTPLTEQDVTPVRPEINVQQLETQRKSDPEGFGQEFLCRPVVDEYRFFDEDTIRNAQAKPDETGLDVRKEHGIKRVLGVDIGINRDDTVISVMDHYSGTQRIQRACIVADDDILREAGVRDPDRANANHIAMLIAYIRNQMDADLVVMDKGGAGETFQRITERKLGRGVIPFDFSAKEDVADMFGDMNIALHENDISLVDDDRLFDELAAIVKEKRDEYARPKFSGKDNSESGKDDMAMATVLSAFPPNVKADAASSVSRKDEEYHTDVVNKPSRKEDGVDGEYNPSHGATSVSRNSRTRKNRHTSRHSRGRK